MTCRVFMPDVLGQGGIEAVNMAIADVGGTVLGKKIVLLSVDHQNKPDIGASKFREWADQNGLNMLLGGSNTGVSIAMAKVAAAKKVPFFAIGAGGASLTGADCTAYTVHYAYDTTALGNGTASAIIKQGGKTWFFVTRRLRVRHAAAGGSHPCRAGQWRQGIGRGACAPGHDRYSSFLLQAQGIRSAGAGTGECRHRLYELAQGGQRIRHPRKP